MLPAPTSFRIGPGSGFIGYMEYANGDNPATRLLNTTGAYARTLTTGLQGKYHIYELSYGRFPELLRQSVLSLMMSATWRPPGETGGLNYDGYLTGLPCRLHARYGIIERVARNLPPANRGQVFTWWGMVADLLARRLLTRYLRSRLTSTEGSIRREFEALMTDIGMPLRHDDTLMGEAEPPEAEDDE